MKNPWKRNATIDPEHVYLAVATTLTSQRLRSTGRLFRGARRTSKQMAATPGCVGFASQALPLRREYRSISLWEDAQALASFVHSGAHGELVTAMGPEVASFRAVHWDVQGTDGRPTWRDAVRHLEETLTAH